jgi:hypothetical protein
MSKTQDKWYYLFGEVVSKEYYADNDFNKLVNLIAAGNVDWHIFCYDDRLNDPDDLLQEADGWMGYARITEDEFNQLSKLKV